MDPPRTRGHHRELKRHRVLGATVVEWAWLKLDVWRTARAITALAREADLPDTASPDAAARAIARWHADLRHRIGQAAPSDALPLLARAAPALSSLSSNAMKSATYADGAWTIELGAIDTGWGWRGSAAGTPIRAD